MVARGGAGTAARSEAILAPVVVTVPRGRASSELMSTGILELLPQVVRPILRLVPGYHDHNREGKAERYCCGLDATRTDGRSS